MSAAKDYINKKWVDWIIGLLVTVIGIFTTVKTEIFGTFATREYVDTQIVIVDEKIQSVKREHAIEMKSVVELLNRIDKRAERIEDRLNQK